MNNILITGATGNVGREIIRQLLQISSDNKILAAARDTKAVDHLFAGTNVKRQLFDFENINTYKPALEACDVLYLLRPPHLADVKKYFEPLINAARECRVKHIVFLSVQGAENNSKIPHHKIEKLIAGSGLPYTFLRPAYFVQNFTTLLRNDIVEKRIIFLPAGRTRFTIIDIRDIALVAALILINPESHENKSYELTNDEKLSFGEIAEKISAAVGAQIKYESPSLLHFFIQKRKEKVPVMFIFVMIMLHYFPRFKKEFSTTDDVKSITGISPKTFEQFLQEHKNLLFRG